MITPTIFEFGLRVLDSHCRIDLSFKQLLCSCKISKISWIIFQTQFRFKNCKIDVSDRHYLNVWFKITVSNTAIIIVIKVIDFTMASGSSTIKHRIKPEYLFSIQAGHCIIVLTTIVRLWLLFEICGSITF